MQELKVIPLKCPGCGAKLDVSDEMDRFVCAYCGSELLTQRRGGTVALRPLTDAIAKVQVSTDKTAAELALRRLLDEQAVLKKQQATYEAQYQSVLKSEEATYIRKFKKQKSSDAMIALSFVIALIIYQLTNSFTSGLIFGAMPLIVLIGTLMVIRTIYKRGQKERIRIAYETMITKTTEIQHLLDQLQARIDEKKRIVDTD
jgi:DNA-directed RNA polymerase subunit RPC12/RpoP